MNVIKYLLLLSIFSLFSCNKNEKRILFWYSDNHHKIFNIDKNKWTFYNSENIYTVELQKEYIRSDTVFFTCKNSFCKNNYYFDDTVVFIIKKEPEDIIKIKDKFNNNTFYPYYESSIRWDSIVISAQYNNKEKEVATLINNQIDKINKTMLAWIINDKKFKMMKVYRKSGNIPIILKLFYNGKVIAQKKTAILFYGMIFSQNIDFKNKIVF